MRHLTVEQAAARLVDVDPIATGRKLRAKRREFDLTLEGLSEIFDRAYVSVSVNSISKWERGVCLPRLDHLFFLSKLYNYSLDELVVGMKESRDSESGDQPVPLIKALIRRTRQCSPYFFNPTVPLFNTLVELLFYRKSFMLLLSEGQNTIY